MFTQCPNCKTLFRVNEEQLTAVDGKVRCGFCYGTFNALNYLYEEMPQEDAAPDEPRPSSSTEHFPDDLEKEYAAEGVNINRRRVDPPVPPGYDEAEPPASVATTTWNEPPPPDPETDFQTQPYVDSPLTANPLEEQSAQSFFEPTPEFSSREWPPSHYEAPTPKAAPAAPTPEPAPATPPPVRPQQPRQPTSPPAAPATSENEGVPSLMEAINLAGREFQQVSRLELATAPNVQGASNGLGSTILWAFATLLMVAFISLQWLYFKRDELATYPQLRPVLEKICAVANCKVPLRRDPSLIKMVSHQIRSHPTTKDALEVRATFVNQAPFAQPYPTLRLQLSDMNGKPIASRKFSPREYLKPNTDAEKGVASQQQVDIKLEIIDPDQKASGFEFTFS